MLARHCRHDPGGGGMGNMAVLSDDGYGFLNHALTDSRHDFLKHAGERHRIRSFPSDKRAVGVFHRITKALGGDNLVSSGDVPWQILTRKKVALVKSHSLGGSLRHCYKGTVSEDHRAVAPCQPCLTVGYHALLPSAAAFFNLGVWGLVVGITISMESISTQPRVFVAKAT